MNITEFYKTSFGFSNPPSTDTDAPVRSIILSGHNDDVSSSTVPEYIWNTGGDYAFPTVAGKLSLSSASANDTSNGTGAQVILIEGLDSNYKQINEQITLNGTTAVESVNNFLRINNARVVLSGSAKTNAGIITGTIGGGNVVKMQAGDSAALQLIYTVPAGHVLFLTNVQFSAQRQNGAEVAIESNVFVPSTNTIAVGTNISLTNGSAYVQTVVPPSMPRIPEKSDLFYKIVYSSANSVQVSGQVRGLLVKNGYIPKFLP